ncbi:MAG TPA: ABC transporter substrate-binding protein [Myxococcaceae bacterium]|nr:ABC transporter substrate-binding protein [Myxococcaceae bacterium]
MRDWSFALVLAVGLLAASCEKRSQPVDGSGASGGTTSGSGSVQNPAAPDTRAPGSASGGSGTAEADTILIGEVGSLTGSEATFGISTRDGVELAVKEANEAGGIKGRKIVVRVYDDQGKPEEAANAVTRLISQDHAKMIIGEVASSNSLAMAPKCQSGQVPMITPSSTNPKVTAVGDYIFRVCFIDPFQGFVMAKFAKENLKFTRAAVLKDVKSAYSLGLTDVFTRKFTEMGGKIVGTESYSKGDSDFRAQLTAIKSQKPEAIYVPGYYTDVGIIARQAREIGIKAPMLGGDGWDSEKLFELGGSAIVGSYFSNHYSPDDPSPRVKKFLATYKAAYGVIPDSLAALGYDAARVAIDAMKRAPDLTGPALRQAVAQTKDFPGVAGTITLDENRNPVKPAVVLQVENGKTKYIATITP